ncbi:MAG: hypothetical protein LBS63_04835 [Prevotellaceae bacterium]|jgi:hypothetical protein|nr:hypothetical protein [Prevotellaceae bacterium]
MWLPQAVANNAEVRDVKHRIRQKKYFQFNVRNKGGRKTISAMKKNALRKNVVMLFAMLLAVGLGSCSKDKDEGNGGANTSPLNNGVLSGKIEGFTGQQYDEFRLYYSSISSPSWMDIQIPISSDGTFSFTLPTPAAGDLQKFDYDVEKDNSVSFDGTYSSDAKYYSFRQLYCYKEDVYTKGAVLCGVKPYTKLSFVYVDKDVSIKGTQQDGSITTTIDLNFKAGWNIEVGVLKSDEHSYTTGSLPDGLSWIDS